MSGRAQPPLLLHVFPGFGVGGAQVRFCAVANRFRRLWRHMVFAMDGNLACRERLDPGLDVTFPSLALHKGDTLGNLRRCRAALRAWAPDVLVTSNFGSIEWALANALPWLAPVARHVHTEDGFGPEERDRQLLRRVLLRRLGLRRTQVVVPSRVLLHLATEVWRLDPARVAYVANGIDLQRFGGPERPVSNEPVSNEPVLNEVVFGTVAALRPEKNLARLLRAFARLPPAPPSRLVVVGDGPERAALQALAASLGVAGRVSFAGHMAQPELAYAGLDVFALSSDTEQMPLSVLEAMAAGLPVVSTDVGDVAGMVSAANRPFIVAADDTVLAAAMQELLGDPVSRLELGTRNRERAAREFDQEAMFQSYAALFAGTGSLPGVARSDL